MENNSGFSKIRFYILLILILVGIATCLDLTYIFWKTNFIEGAAPSFCTVSDLIDCDGVSRTSYALTFGVPNSIWGLLLYGVMLMLLFVDKIQAKFKNTIFDCFENPRSYIGSLAFIAFALSMILAFISINVIHKICVLCFATYIIDLFIALVASPLFDDFETMLLDFAKGVKKYTTLFLIVMIAFCSVLYFFESTLVFSPKLKKERRDKEFFSNHKNKYAIKGNVLGNPNADVVVKIYSDFNCPFCRVANKMLHKAAIDRDILVEAYNFPLNNKCNNRVASTMGGHENACALAYYALAAKKQGKYWGATSVLFDTQPISEEQVEKEFNKAHLGLDFNQLKSDAMSPAIVQELREEINESAKSHVMGTPCIEINGIQYMGLMTYDDLLEKIDLEKKRIEMDKNPSAVQGPVQNQQNQPKEKFGDKIKKLIKKQK